jgi:hypothetical protein
VPVAAHQHRQTAQTRVVALLDGGVEGVHVDVKNVTLAVHWLVHLSDFVQCRTSIVNRSPRAAASGGAIRSARPMRAAAARAEQARRR